MKKLLIIIAMILNIPRISNASLAKAAIKTAHTLGPNIAKSMPILQIDVNNLISTITPSTETITTKSVPTPTSPIYPKYFPVNNKFKTVQNNFPVNSKSTESSSQAYEINEFITSMKNKRFDMPDDIPYQNNYSKNSNSSMNQQKRSFSMQSSQKSHFFNKNNSATAIHEAGHAIAVIYIDIYSILNEATIKPSSLPENFFTESNITSKLGKFLTNCIFKAGGHINFSKKQSNLGNIDVNDPETFCRTLKFKNLQSLYINTIVSLAGIVAQQISDQLGLFNSLPQELLTDENQILLLMSSPNAIGDLQSIYSNIKNHKDTVTNEQMNEIIVQCYKITHELLTKYKDELEKVSDLLLKNGTVSGDEIYNILELNKPLKSNELGPLPASLINQYNHRTSYTPNTYKNYIVTEQDDKNTQYLKVPSFYPDSLQNAKIKIPKVYTISNLYGYDAQGYQNSNENLEEID